MKKYTNYNLIEHGKGALHRLIEQIDETDHVFAADYIHGDRTIKFYMSTKNRVEFIKNNRNEPNLYEVILKGRSCTFACDIDGCPILNEEDVKLFQDSFCQHFNRIWPNTADKCAFVWLKSLKETTGSYHVIIHVANGSRRFGFKCFTQQRHFWATFPRSGPFVDIELDGKKKLVIDDIYTSNRCLRTIYSSKLGQNRPVTLWNLGREFGINATLVLQEVQEYLPVDEYKSESNIYMTRYKSGSGLECGTEINQKDLIISILDKCPWKFTNRRQWARMNYAIKYLLGEDGLDVSSQFFISRGWDSEEDIDKNTNLYNTLIVREPCTIDQFYEVCGVNKPQPIDENMQILDLKLETGTEKEVKTDLSIDDIDWEAGLDDDKEEAKSDLSTRDIMIGEWLSLTTIQVKNPKFAKKLALMLSSFLGNNMKQVAGPWLTMKVEDKETLTIIEQLYKNPHKREYNIVELSGILKVSNVKWDEEYNEVRVRPYPQLDKHIFVRSGTGTGKTYRIFKQYALNEKKKILIVCYRRMLTRDLMAYRNDEKFKDLDFGHYEEEDIINGARTPDIFMCQLESLHKFSERISYYDVIVFDESENIISQIDNIKAGSQFERTRLLFEYILKNRCIIAMSANLNHRTFNFIKRYSDRKIYAIRNNYLDKQDYTVELYLGWEQKIRKLIESGKRLACAINSKSKAERFHAFFSKMFPQKKMLLMTSKTAKSNEEVMLDIDKSWSQYDVVFYSSCIEAGVSFDVENHFDHICAYFTRGANHYLSQYQSMFRVRHPKFKNIIMYVQNDINSDKYFPMTKKDLIHVYKLKGFLKQLNIEDRLAFKTADLGKLEVNFDDPLNLTMIENLSFNMKSQAFLKSLLLAELQEAGAKIIEGDEDRYIVPDGPQQGLIRYKPTEEDKQNRQIATTATKEQDIANTINSNEEGDRVRRRLFTSVGIVSGKVEGDDIKLDETAPEKLKELTKKHKTLNSATKNVQNYMRLDKFHRYLQKLDYLKTLPEHPYIDRQNYRMNDPNGHYANSASKQVMEVHNILNVLGYYDKSVAPTEMLKKMTEHLFDKNKTYELYNKLFKPYHSANWIGTNVLEGDNPSKKIKAYYRGILNSYNLTVNDTKGSITIIPKTDIKLKTIDDYKIKIADRIKNYEPL